MNASSVKTGVAWFASDASRNAHQPLMNSGIVEALEWTIDSLRFKPVSQKDAFILEDYADRKTLSGHGVHYSVLSAGVDDLRQRWLKHLKNDPWRERYAHVSVHFGFSTGWKLTESAPLPVPFSTETLDIGRRNLEALAKVVPCRIGLENLALAFSKKDVEEQGKFLEDLLSPFDGFLLMDLHNIYCQSVNFGVDMMELVKTYPLHRVEEIHISGGSWSESSGKKIRRDTHDGSVPNLLFEILPQVITLCPQLKFIFLEQLPSALKTKAQHQQIAQDYMRLHSVVNANV